MIPPSSGGCVVVTGSAQGLGAVIARSLFGHGWNVVLADVQGEMARAIAADLDSSGEAAVGLSADVTEVADLLRVLQIAEERWGRVVGLVNNAAITRAEPLMDISAGSFNQVLNVNLGGTFAACQTFGRLMAQSGYGRIVNIGSLAGQNGGTATGGHYAASKGAIHSLTKLFARELAPSGVTVNAIAPGPLDLPVVHELVSPERMPTFLNAIPVRQLGSAEFVADVVNLLLQPTASFVTGACWDVNGGLSMR